MTIDSHFPRNVKPPVPLIKLPLPANWRAMRARELFDLTLPLPDGHSCRPLPGGRDLSEVPEWREMVEQAERYKKAQPEFQFPELLEFDEAAHYSYYGNGVRAPLPKNCARLRADVHAMGVARLRRPTVAPGRLAGIPARAKYSPRRYRRGRIIIRAPPLERRLMDPLFQST